MNIDDDGVEEGLWSLPGFGCFSARPSLTRKYTHWISLNAPWTGPILLRKICWYDIVQKQKTDIAPRFGTRLGITSTADQEEGGYSQTHMNFIMDAPQLLAAL
jgi:hypothetical protein